jgi:dienelactone hydrolase
MENRTRRFLVQALLVGCLSDIASRTCGDEWAPDFSYAADAPLELKTVRVTFRSEVAVHDLTFASPTTNRLRAYLLVPPGSGKFAGLLYVHWLGDPATSSRNQFLNEATTMAQRGAVCLLVDALWSDLARFPWTGSDYVFDRNQCVRQVKDLRRALDLLLSRPEVDPARVGYVGHDFGAMAGAQLAGADQRVRAYALIAGTPRFHYWFFRWSGLSSKRRAEYQAGMAPVDPITLIAKSAPAAVLFQFSRRGDGWVSEADGQEFYDAAGGPKQVLWYVADHSMSLKQIREDRLAWLRKQLLCSGEFRAGLPPSSGQPWSLAFTGQPGSRYRLEWSATLNDWRPWTNVVGQESTLWLVDESAAASSCRFYRAVLEP